MPDVDPVDGNGCGPTHHFACACREAMFKKLDSLHLEYSCYCIKGLEQDDWVNDINDEIHKLREALGLCKESNI